MDKIYKDYVSNNEIELHSIHDKTISLKTAKKRVKRWLETIGSMPEFKDNPKKIPRAILISMDDIKQLQEKYTGAVGIRVYFGLGGEAQPTVGDLDGLIVPVLLKDTGEAIDPIANDTTETDLLVYDFTTPCPPVCNMSSELYIPFPTSD